MSTARFQIPMIGGPGRRMGAKEATSIVESIMKGITTIVKPSRRLGAGWTCDQIDQGLSVVMCDVCVRKYNGWWKRANYRPDWGFAWTGDCDGCGMPGRVTLFKREDDFYSTLTKVHGRLPKP